MHADNNHEPARAITRAPVSAPPEPSPTGAPTRLAALTSLRFFAALLVVFAHFGVLTIPQALGGVPILQGTAAQIGATGYVGVNFFFLLSGFILAYTYLRPDGGLRVSVRAFYVARFARIYPAYLVGFDLSAIAVALWRGYPWDSTPIAATYYQHPTAVLTTDLTLTQTWFPNVSEVFNPPAWSLPVECFFYALFPLLGVMTGRINARYLTAAAAVFWAIALAPATVVLVTGATLSTDQLWMLHFAPIIRLPEFLCGVAIGRVFVLRPSRALSPPPAWLVPSVLVLLAAGIIIGPGLPNDLMQAGLLDPLWLMLLYRAASGDDATSRFLAHPWLVALGEASYALYILHFPLWIWMTEAFPLPRDPMSGAAYYLAYLGMAIACSLIVYRFYEMPVRVAIRSWLAG